MGEPLNYSPFAQLSEEVDRLLPQFLAWRTSLRSGECLYEVQGRRQLDVHLSLSQWRLATLLRILFCTLL